MTAMAWRSCGVWNETCRPTPAQQARAARLAAQIAETAQARLHPARHPHRADDPLRLPPLPLSRRPALLHGPYHQWTRKINGKTVTRILTDDQIADYKPWFDNQRRLRELHRRAGNPQQGDHRQRPPLEPPGPPAGVGSTRLTCRRTSRQAPLAQVIPKRENLTRLRAPAAGCHVSRLTCSTLMTSCPSCSVTVYQMVTSPAGRCSSVGAGQWVVAGEGVREGRDRLVQQMKDRALHRPSQRLRQGLDLLPGRTREADEAVTHVFPMPQRAPRG